ncbi:protein RICE SALT SENSITIVE 3-like isoform X1 [Zingiber officinale]|uniref:protein RICE SALT SENSITIVE 3-like isoform X1 n=1 Tax=Zingiber officinale TaxID=94328 RepID=UPI001C4B9B1A|nr:protein RICE SALT SENSITIVE 3-like isoform X1 [Zingiber officinale]
MVVEARRLWACWLSMSLSGTSASTRTGLTPSSGPFALARTFLLLPLLSFPSLSPHELFSPFFSCRRCRGGNGCKIGDDNGNLMLMWEDGFCRSRVDEMDAGEDPVRKAFSKMSIQLYNYGEGLMGKVASDKCHKWVFKEPSESEPNISNYWQSSFDALPPEWNDQFASGIQTIAVIQAGHGLLQLGSCKIIPEDLHFVLRMRHMFESLGYQSGFFLSQLFSSTRGSSPSPSSSMKQIPRPPPPPIFNWSHPSLAPIPAMAATPAYNPMGQEHEPDLKWPNGLSFFTALTGRTDDAKLLFGTEMLEQKPADSKPGMGDDHHLALSSASNADQDLMSTESQRSCKGRKMESSSNKFKRSLTFPATSLDHQHHHQHAGTAQGMDYRGSDAGIYQDIMETFLD